MASPSVVLCADWAKDTPKRAVWLADVGTPSVSRLAPRSGGWTFDRLLSEARSRSARGPVLVAIDAAIGVPEEYFDRRLSVSAWASTKAFLDWLPAAHGTPGFYTETQVATDWAVASPFISVPKGTGARSAFVAAAGDLLRRIDRASRAMPMFIVSGIPGTVGSGTRELWREMAPLLTAHREFRVWPFDGPLDDLLEAGITVAEIYPRVMYRVAAALPLGEAHPSKLKRESRTKWLAALAEEPWIDKFAVDLRDLDEAARNDDDFDACFSAAALLMTILEGGDLTAGGHVDSVVEGAILLAGPEPVRDEESRDVRRRVAPPRPAKPAAPVGATEYRCPIAGCIKVFSGSRGGWDAHVESLRTHPDWNPDLLDRHERKRRFKAEHASWFTR